MPKDLYERLYRKLELALEASQIGIWEHNLVTGEMVWDLRLREIYAMEPDEDVDWLSHVHPDDRARAEAEFEAAAEIHADYASQFRILRPDGSIRHLRSKAQFLREADGTPLMIGAEWDITSDIEMQEELLYRAKLLEESYSLIEHSASHDHLTELPNRRALERYLKGHEERTAAGAVAVLHIDLDHFKAVNDTMGHNAGDQLLRGFAERLRAILPSAGFAARIGGDEFLVIIESARMETTKMLAQAVVSAAAKCSHELFGVRDWQAGASVGAALGTSSFDILLKEADAALYEAKRRGRNGYRIASDPQLRNAAG